MLVASLNTSTAAVVTPPNPEHGALGVAQSVLGGVLGLVGAPFDLMDTGIAMAANAVFGNGVALPALTLGAMHVGSMHGHLHPPSLIPPAPMVPLPSLGVAQLASCASVLIGGMPAIRAGDMGVALTCVSLAPVFEIGTGSSNVFIGGARAGRAMDLTLHCNPMGGGAFMIGMAVAGAALGVLGAATSAMDSSASSDAEAAASAAGDAAAAEAAGAAAAGQALGAATSAAQAALDVAALALMLMCGKDPGVGPGIGMMVPLQAKVLIGGVPIPNWLDMAKDLFKAARRLARAVGGRVRRRPGHGEDATTHGHCDTC